VIVPHHLFDLDPAVTTQPNNESLFSIILSVFQELPLVGLDFVVLYLEFGPHKELPTLRYDKVGSPRLVGLANV
jgi:hypothetical protein